MDDLKLIKKYYGEKMMHLCRELFPAILETPGLLFEIIDSIFDRTKYLYEDIINQGQEDEFKNFIYKFTNFEHEEKVVTNKNPFELMKEAGYTLFQCETEEEIQSFKKYYQKDEELCTFRGGRLNRDYVFFAVKDNVNEIKRENFIDPKRQDEYGTSVISIQFSKGEVNTLSIKNRYNHIVPNCDATFGNNLENIIPGLTHSFSLYLDLNISQNENDDFELEGYVFADDKKLYKYNYERNNIYFCPNNLIIYDGEVIKTFQEKERYVFCDYFILDLKDKKIIKFHKNIDDSFYDGIKELEKDIEKIEVIKEKENKIINIILKNKENVLIKIDRYSRIIEYKNNNIKYIKDNFLPHNEVLEKITLNNVIEIGNYFLGYNTELKEINISNIRKIGNDFLKFNHNLEKLTALKLEKIGIGFICYNTNLKEISCPNLKEVGSWFLTNNKLITSIDFPLLKKCGNKFLKENEIISKINLPSIEEIGDDFLHSNLKLKKINFPKLKFIGNYFISENEVINSIYLPLVIKVKNNFLACNECLEEVDMPMLVENYENFLYSNQIIEKINFPLLMRTGMNFMYSNKDLKEVDLPNLRKAFDGFMANNENLKYLNVPKLQPNLYRYLKHLEPVKEQIKVLTRNNK